MRIPCRWTIALWGGVVLCGCTALAVAADPPDARRSNTEENAEAGSDRTVKEVQPPVIYLRNKNGDLLQSVFGFTFEDFEKLRNQRVQRALGQQTPRIQLERLNCRGQAANGHANLSIELSALVNDSGWVRLPLRLGAAALRSKAQYKGPGEYLVEFDAEAQEHVLWLRGQSPQPHLVTLDVIVPVEKAADQGSLKVDFPRAAVSELTLVVPELRAVATVPEGGVLDSTQHSKAGTEFKVLGLERGFTITWRKEEAETPNVPALLEASGAIDARVDGSGVHSEVQLTVRSFAVRFDSFRIRVPEGTTLWVAEQAGYTIDPIVEKSDQAGPRRPRLFEVRLREKGLGPVVVRFSMDRPHTDGGAQRSFELTGVELLGAARQWGFVAVRVASDWQIGWGEPRQARQVDELPAELDRGPVVAGFEYFGQSFAIPGHITPLKSHVTVDPQYAVEVGPRQLRLQARLKYQVRGAKAFAVEVSLAGWELDDVAPRNVFDVDHVGVQVEEGKALRVPLLQATTGEFELILRAHRDLTADARQIEFALPRPIADASAPAQLTVLAAANVSLALHEEDLVGLSRIRAGATGPATVTDRQGEMVFRGDGPDLRFAADLRIESGSVRAEVRTRIDVEEQATKVEETILYKVAHEPLAELVVEVPAWLAESGRMQWTLDGQSVSAATVDGEPNQEQMVRLRVPLAEKRLGTCKLVAHYSIDSERLAPGPGAMLNVPLAMPIGAELGANEVLVAAGPGIKVQPRDDAWTLDPASAGGARPTLKLTATAATPAVDLLARLEERRSFDPLVVERAWIQTRLADGERFDRAVFQFSGGETRVTLRLPPGASAAEARATLDGVALPAQPPASRETLTFELSSARRRHVLDVSYRFASRVQDHGQLSLIGPELGSNLWVRQTYWELVLPRDEHLVYWSRDLSGAFSWRFQNGLWGRQPLLDQARLESWIDATHGPEVPEKANRYLLTALGSVKSLDVYTGHRATLVMIAAGGVLLLGLLLLYFPVLRHPALLFVAGIALLTAALLFPDPALLAAQVAVVGAGLFILAAIVDRILKSRRTRPRALRTVPSSILEPGSTRTHLRAQSASGSAEHVPLMPQTTGSEGER